MAVPTWQPGTLYQPGDIVQPITMPAPTAAQVANGDFASGNTNWEFTGGAEYVTTGGYANNGPCVRMPGTVADGLALNKTKLVVPSTGSTFEASAMIQQGASIAGATKGWVEVRWYDEDNVQLSAERGNIVSDGSNGAWKKSTVTATRPAGAAYARCGIGLFSVADHNHPIWGDNLSVSGTFAGLPDGLVYKAVQSASGFSSSSEPAWPPILGQTVVDNEVTWEAVASTRVTWEASPLYVSGTGEPTWPTDIGGYVRDGTINWKAVSRRVEDENCPNTKIVAIAASKVYAGDDDIVKYSATVNPLDWTTTDDAGYLPTGLQNYGANPVAAMGLYRSNLLPFNAEGCQLWQVDEDPASISLIDALPLGSTQHHALTPVSNDLFFLSSQGVRTIGIAASSTNYQAGDVGMPIDPLVQAAMTGDDAPIGLYYPAAGQYWLIFNLEIELKAPDIRAVTLIPSTGSFAYATQPYTRTMAGTTSVENVHTASGRADVLVALDQLFAELPGCDTISLVVSWFGDDLRAGECQIKPRLAVAPGESSSVTWSPGNWSVEQVTASTATLVTYVSDSAGGHSVYGSTPSDASIRQVIQYLKGLGKRIVFYPFVLMDVPTGNALPNPYGGTGQPVNPWRGRVTCYPAPGVSGSPDATAAAGSQIDAFFTREWGFNRFIRHCVTLCSPYFKTGDVFIVGTEMVGITQVRSARTTYPAVPYLRALAAEVKAVMPRVLVSYAADWTEYHSRQYSNGDLNFHLDPFWADANVDFVGIDNYLPIADVRDTDAGALVYDLDYLKSNIEGGELFDWYYVDRTAGTKAPITDGGYNKPWVYRQKDIRGWWSNTHVARQEYTETTATAWVPGSKPIWFTEYGCPAINRGPNQPNVFYDPNSSESTLPYFSTGIRDDRAQWAYYTAMLEYWAANGGAMLSIDNMIAWTWDARPYPQFPQLTSAWGDYGNYPRGHWLQGRAPTAEQAEAFVYTMTKIGQVGAWSRYVFPFTIQDWAIKGDSLYLRSGDLVHRLDDTVIGDETAPGSIRPFECTIQWPWLDFGQPGQTKSLYGFDMVGIGDVSVQFGYDQSRGGVFTDPYKVPADTVPGMVIPMPLSAPSFSVKLTYDGTERWQWNAFQLYLQDLRGMT